MASGKMTARGALLAMAILVRSCATMKVTTA
jgi:hypothetical protein